MATAIKDKKTPVFDFKTGEFMTDDHGRILTTGGILGAVVVIMKAQQTPRATHPVYRNAINTRLNHKYGNSAWHILTRPDLTEEVRLSEMKRAMREAILYDPWVLEVYNMSIVRRSVNERPVRDGSKQTPVDVLDTEFTVRTIFDEELTVRGVVYNDQAVL